MFLSVICNWPFTHCWHYPEMKETYDQSKLNYQNHEISKNLNKLRAKCANL